MRTSLRAIALVGLAQKCDRSFSTKSFEQAIAILYQEFLSGDRTAFQPSPLKSSLMEKSAEQFITVNVKMFSNFPQNCIKCSQLNGAMVGNGDVVFAIFLRGQAKMTSRLAISGIP
jgi:hypothetical protein